MISFIRVSRGHLGRPHYTYIDILHNVNMQSPILSFQLEIGDGVVELNLGQTVSNSLIYLGALVALVMLLGKFALEGVFGCVAVVERDGYAPP